MGGKIRTSPDQQKMSLDGIADGLFGRCGVCGERGPANSLDSNSMGSRGSIHRGRRILRFGVIP
jgi:hypothetical protein